MLIEIIVGYQVQLGVIVKDKYGNPIESFSTPTWSVSDDSFCSISAEGIFSAGTVVGNVDVSVDMDGLSATENVALIPDAPDSVEITVGTPEPIVIL